MGAIQYGIIVTDSRSCTHSIDKMKIKYIIDIPYSEAFLEVKSTLESMSKWKYQPDRSQDGWNGYESKPPCSSYSWYNSSLWCDGCMFRFGAYHKDKIRPRWDVLNVVTVEFNPNKSYSRSEINTCLVYLKSVSSDHIYLQETDYTVDVPCKTNQIITQCLKNRVLIQDSRYYGKRHQHGRLKVYNKRKEIKDKDKVDIEHDLTRCEITCCWGGNLEFTECTLCTPPNKVTFGLSANLRSITNLVLLLQSYGEDAKELIDQYIPDKRNRDKLLPYVVGVQSYYIFAIDTFINLLEQYRKVYGFNYSYKDSVTQKIFVVDAQIVNGKVNLIEKSDAI